eukprot:2393052-Prymnesium_polylepis.1
MLSSFPLALHGISQSFCNSNSRLWLACGAGGTSSIPASRSPRHGLDLSIRSPLCVRRQLGLAAS